MRISGSELSSTVKRWPPVGRAGLTGMLPVSGVPTRRRWCFRVEASMHSPATVAAEFRRTDWRQATARSSPTSLATGLGLVRLPRTPWRWENDNVVGDGHTERTSPGGTRAEPRRRHSGTPSSREHPDAAHGRPPIAHCAPRSVRLTGGHTPEARTERLRVPFQFGPLIESVASPSSWSGWWRASPLVPSNRWTPARGTSTYTVACSPTVALPATATTSCGPASSVT